MPVTTVLLGEDHPLVLPAEEWVDYIEVEEQVLHQWLEVDEAVNSSASACTVCAHSRGV
ncbi:hypothetical protein Hamer_G012551 [Homarus americanus]|uniref:Uncharacterized protein n=1 Tax=Homarus americanus TaxID=6706 RepID=A0A8J5N152_HOMAM|nr:hypothetical protein Hamer_G012551 [Homarus americanus]